MGDYEPRPRYYNVVKQPIVGIGVSLVNTLLDCVDQITIGDYVSFGHDCMLLTGYHDYQLKREKRMSSSFKKPITIKSGAWLASRVTVLPGVTIGEDSVVGAGAVVNKDIPDNQFWAGVPARFIKNI
jgi:acetyltransferase-like isoleucine patch superfamily enzyme